MKTRTLLPALALISFVAGSALAQAGHTGGCTCGQFSSVPVPWQIEHSTTAYQDAARAELNRWNNVANATTSTLGDGASASGNGKNEILFVTGTLSADTFGLAAIIPRSAFAGTPAFDDCSERAPSTVCGTFTEADVLINEDFVRGFTPNGPPDFDDDNGPAYYGATALHEIGHTLGLHHNFRNLSTMNYVEDYVGQYLTIADAVPIRAAYPGQVKSMTDVGTYPFRYDPSKQSYAATTPVSFSPASVTSGSSTITISNATVENVGTQNLTGARIEFYLSTDSTITPSDIFIGAFTYSSLPSTGYDDEPFPDIPIPSSVPSGSYFVGARILQNASTADGITYNNAWASPEQLTVTGSGGGGTTCVPSASALCLNSSRFLVTLTARDPRTGATAPGVATAFNGNVGYYSLPALTTDPSNLEVFVKVLDGRAINGKFWVFYGGLTDFELTIRVTDMTSGVVKTYERPGEAYGGGADTSAF